MKSRRKYWKEHLCGVEGNHLKNEQKMTAIRENRKNTCNEMDGEWMHIFWGIKQDIYTIKRLERRRRLLICHILMLLLSWKCTDSMTSDFDTNRRSNWIVYNEWNILLFIEWIINIDKNQNLICDRKQRRNYINRNRALLCRYVDLTSNTIILYYAY